MTISLTKKTQKLLDKQMKTGLFANADDIVRLALQTLEQIEEGDYSDLDQETRDAIEQGEVEFQRGEFRPWSKVRAKLKKRFVK